MASPDRHIQVACAVIEHDGLILATQRSADMSLPLKWEFPGGKLEPGESLQECLMRELREELCLSVSIGRPLEPVTYHYPDLSVTLHPFLCDRPVGTLSLQEHADARWLPRQRLGELDWAAADWPIIKTLVEMP